MPTGRHTGRTFVIVAVILVLTLIAIRAALPWYLTRYVNRLLADMPDYRGHVADIDLAIWRGAAAIEGIELVKKEGDVPLPLATVPRVDASLNWRALFHGTLISDIHVQSPTINLVAAETKEKSQLTISRRWAETAKQYAETAKRYMPVKINSLEVTDATVRFRAVHTKPNVDLHLTQGHVLARNLANVEGITGERYATVDAQAMALDHAPATLHVDLDPLARTPTFTMTAELKSLQLVKMNEFLQAYGKFDVEQGTMEVYTEIAASGGRFKGYVKPFFDNVKVLGPSDKEKGLGRRLWEALVGGVKNIFEREPEQEVATRIPLQGKLDNPDVGVWETIVTLVRNAFIEALRHGFDQPIDLGPFRDGGRGERGGRTGK